MKAEDIIQNAPEVRPVDLVSKECRINPGAGEPCSPIFKEVWTVYEVEHFKFYGRDSTDKAVNKWVKELNFYAGNITTTDVKKDDRFIALKNRKEAICRGTVTNIVFPVVYPLITDSGLSLDGYEPLIYETEDDYNKNI
jgi:hypothetical protein